MRRRLWDERPCSLSREQMTCHIYPLCCAASMAQALKQDAATGTSQPLGSSLHWLEEYGAQGEAQSRDTHLAATNGRDLSRRQNELIPGVKVRREEKVGLRLERVTIKWSRREAGLTGVAWWIECQCANRRVHNSIPCQCTCLGCGPGPWWMVHKTQPHIDVSLPLFLSLFPSLHK